MKGIANKKSNAFSSDMSFRDSFNISIKWIIFHADQHLKYARLDFLWDL